MISSLLRDILYRVLLSGLHSNVITGLPGGEKGLDFFGVEIGGRNSFIEVLSGARGLFDNDLHRVIFIPFGRYRKNYM